MAWKRVTISPPGSHLPSRWEMGWQCGPSAVSAAGPFRTASGEDAHLTGGEIVVAASDRQLPTIDRRGQDRFGGAQLLDAHHDIGPHCVVELITWLVDHALCRRPDRLSKAVGVARNR